MHGPLHRRFAATPVTVASMRNRKAGEARAAFVAASLVVAALTLPWPASQAAAAERRLGPGFSTENSDPYCAQCDRCNESKKTGCGDIKTCTAECQFACSRCTEKGVQIRSAPGLRPAAQPNP